MQRILLGFSPCRNVNDCDLFLNEVHLFIIVNVIFLLVEKVVFCRFDQASNHK